MTKSSDDRTGFSFSTLLIPTDLTPTSDRVLGRVALLPLAPDARLTLLHVIPGSLPPAAQRRAARDARKALAEEARDLARSIPRKVTIAQLVSVGAAAPEIAELCAKTNPQLVVMGRGGARAIRDTFLGSTAERIIRRAHVPVLVVRLSPRASYERPALALDIDEAARAALAQLLQVIPAPRPRVTVIHAYDVPYQGLIYPSLTNEDAEEYREDFRRKAVQDIGGLLTAAVTRAKLPPGAAPAWRTHLQLGSPRIIIPKVVKKADSDLLILGTRGRSGLAYAFLGTVAGEVLRDVHCDVLVVPPAPAKRAQ